MEDRVEFRHDRKRALVLGLSCMAAAVWMFWDWWNLTFGVTFDNRELSMFRRGYSGLALPAALLAGFGLWELSKLASQRVLVALDRQGITDFRLKTGPILWAEIERIEQVVSRKARGFRKPRGLRLVMRGEPQAPIRYPGKRETVIWERGLRGGGAALRDAITKMAPQVPLSRVETPL